MALQMDKFVDVEIRNGSKYVPLTLSLQVPSFKMFNSIRTTGVINTMVMHFAVEIIMFFSKV